MRRSSVRSCTDRSGTAASGAARKRSYARGVADDHQGARLVPSLSLTAVGGRQPHGCTCCDDYPCAGNGPDEGWLRYTRYALLLAWASLAWMTAEGAIGLIAGITAGSIAVIGWAAGSAV